MTALALGAALALPAAFAYLLLGRLLGPPSRDLLAVGARLAEAILLGLGLSALLAFAWLLAGGRLGGPYAAVDAGAFVIAAAGLARAARGVRPAPSSPPDALGRAAQVALALGLVVATAAVVGGIARLPHGEWDAWAIWNLRARFLLRAGSAWRDAFVPDLAWSRPEYPLLLPLAVARLFAYAGETTAAPQLVAALFTLLAPVALAGAVARRSGPLAGGGAALLLLATPSWIWFGTCQYADVPVASYLLIGFALAGASLEAPEERGRAAMGGLALGLAGFTKNEGLAGAACAFVVWGLLAWRARGARAALRELSAVGAGAALPALAWATFHLAVSPGIAPALTQSQSAASLAAKVLDPERWTTILGHAAGVFPGVELWLPAAALALPVLLGLRPRALASVAMLAPALIFLQTIAVFLVTPLPLAWHLSSAMNRVLLHPWPALLLALFGAVPPAEAPAASAARSAAR
ncbi:MAG TPA: hypothetical protein VML50_16245 [Anaeromyxobacter sp.]|nr:hypothetical protein [Anaeromyxobacter sp.]